MGVDSTTFDSFWFGRPNSQLYNSVDHIIGTESVDLAKIRLIPEVTINKDRLVKTYIGPFAYEYEDEEVALINYY